MTPDPKTLLGHKWPRRRGSGMAGLGPGGSVWSLPGRGHCDGLLEVFKPLIMA